MTGKICPFIHGNCMRGGCQIWWKCKEPTEEQIRHKKIWKELKEFLLYKATDKTPISAVVVKMQQLEG